MDNDKIKVDSGFDRGLDYLEIKKDLIKDYTSKCEQVRSLQPDTKGYVSQKRILMNQITYLLISLIGLKNGARSIESTWMLRESLKNRKLSSTILVKIAKSESTKYNRHTKEKYMTKIRYRKMVFPTKWIKYSPKLLDEIEFYSKKISDDRLKKRTLDYLLMYHNCNTHSLRYCFINYMINEKKVEINNVSKCVGHKTVSQIVNYTQNKNVDKVLDMD